MKNDQKKKIVWILLPNLKVGGAEVFLTSLAAELHSRYDFIFFVNDSEAELHTPGQTVYTHANPCHFFYRLIRLSWLQPPDVVLSSIIDMNLIALIIKYVTPASIKYIVREALPLREASSLMRAPKLYLRLAQKLYPKADAIVNLSKSLQRSLEMTIPGISNSTKTVVIPNGVTERRMIANAGAACSSTTIVSIGRLEYQKGFDALIRAFSAFQTMRPQYILKIIGEGSEQTNLEALIAHESNEKSIQLCGKLKDPISELATAAFFVMPSRYEGLSNAMLEALVNGVPVLATKRDTSAEEIITTRNGVLIDFCDDQKILDGLMEMDHRLALFDRAEIAKSAREEFSIKSSAKYYRDLIDDILNSEEPASHR
ncbi:MULTISPECIES: glycosyltransferase [unclassified Marinobacter]|uniref:glycosyltransferase n=1 Tax=unclassified Marinobacter TaxID=83889 RepID=UPI001268EFB6|nr:MULTISPECIES: glycosyltransferase [unclassified Marinobacter]QFS87786.1 N-acetylgalactosamine-N,N'-diacetylbacillosaminyl-diphospho-undecaprenol 4-alpha-N-acetylgalactosaminyltransferase [Marinobacter sp. THAF197a]QFT51571.1 N-acetylgalactosamine-N,N'-diacetylbacillosaminyl-diphospho-undecaprenol 4-alpha-N-acetylgalactosaminyltransferase [Marinobacter sp. THAF39]